jgi:hypothetical protein
VFVVALAARVYSVLSLAPGSDVYYYDTQAAQLILQGIDPYGHLFTGIPPQLATPGAQDVFAYLPFTALYLVPFYLLGDVRLGAVAADMIIGLCLFQFGRKWSLPMSALFLLAPLTYYTNDATIATAFVAISLALDSRGRKLMSSVSLGIALATSLFVWLALPFFAYRYVRRGDLRHLSVALAAFAAISLPFFAAAPWPFLYDVLLFQFGRAAPGLVTAGGSFGITLNPSMSGFMTTLVGQPAPLILRGGVALAILAILLLARSPSAGGINEGRGGRGLDSWMLLRSSLFVAAAVFVIPAVFFFAYAEFPIVLFLCWLAML